MVRNILVALGSNPESDMALIYADRLARHVGASVVALHVAQKDLIPTPFEPIRKYIESEAEKERYRIKEEVTELRHKDVWKRITFRITPGEYPAEELLFELDKGQHDLIVIGHREQPNVKKMLLGSVSLKVVEYAEVSVLVVKKLVGPTRVLFCTDGSRYAEEAITFAGEMVARIGCEAVVLNVSPWTCDQCVPVAYGIAEKSVHLLRDMGVEATARVRLGKAVAGEILKEIQEGKFDLAVIGSRGISGFARFLLGSMSFKLINQIECPILVYKQPLRKYEPPQDSGSSGTSPG